MLLSFRGAPPPPPPPNTLMEDASLSLNSLVAAVMPIAVLALFLLAAAAVYVKRR